MVIIITTEQRYRTIFVDIGKAKQGERKLKCQFNHLGVIKEKWWKRFLVVALYRTDVHARHGLNYTAERGCSIRYQLFTSLYRSNCSDLCLDIMSVQLQFYLFPNIPKRDLMAFTAFWLMKDSSNFSISSSNSSVSLIFARSGSERMVCKSTRINKIRMTLINQNQLQLVKSVPWNHHNLLSKHLQVQIGQLVPVKIDRSWPFVMHDGYVFSQYRIISWRPILYDSHL